MLFKSSSSQKHSSHYDINEETTKRQKIEDKDAKLLKSLHEKKIVVGAETIEVNFEALQEEFDFFQNEVNKDIELLELLKNENREASKDESIQLKTGWRNRFPKKKSCLYIFLLEVKTQELRKKSSNSNSPDLLLLDSWRMQKFFTILANLPSNTVFDYFIVIACDTSGHLTPLRAHSDGEKTRFFLLDASGVKTENIIYAKLLANIMNAEIYMSIQRNRQYDSFSCLTYAMEDLDFMWRTNPDELETILTEAKHSDDEHVKLPLDLVKYTQRTKNIEKYIDVNPGNLIVEGTKTTLKEYMDTYKRSVKYKNYSIESNFAFTYAMAEFLQIAREELEKLKTEENKDTLVKDIIKKVTASTIIETRGKEVNALLAKQLSCDIKMIEEITSKYSSYDIYKIKLVVEFKIPLEEIKYDCLCFGPGADASKKVYELIAKKSSKEDPYTYFREIKMFDLNQIYLMNDIQEQPLLNEDERNFLEEIIEDGLCFKGRKFNNSLTENDEDFDISVTGQWTGVNLYPLRMDTGADYTILDYKKASEKAYTLIKQKLSLITIKSTRENKNKIIDEISEITYCISAAEMTAISQLGFTQKELEESGFYNRVDREEIFTYAYKLYNDESLTPKQKKPLALKFIKTIIDKEVSKGVNEKVKLIQNYQASIPKQSTIYNNSKSAHFNSVSHQTRSKVNKREQESSHRFIK